MDPILAIEAVNWEGPFSYETCDKAVRGLEEGKVLFFPRLSFPLLDSEYTFLSPQTVHRSKNVSFDPKTGNVGGTGVIGFKLNELRDLMDRYATASGQLVHELLPAYRVGIRQGRTSLRPVEIEGRQSSWRKDDTRLHVDSFPSTPTQGKRVLRVFCNVNHQNRPRVWRIGEPFKAVAHRFWPKLPASSWIRSTILSMIRATKGARTPYDHYMLQLHDRMKEDQVYQAHAQQIVHAFPPGSTWICYTDQVSHAALSVIHQLEQTFYVPVSCLVQPQTAPVRVLEGLAHRKLA
jgi:3-deoxy-D-manno-oct-2-ulosonic acid (Kdo) hydroxylase